MYGLTVDWMLLKRELDTQAVGQKEVLGMKQRKTENRGKLRKACSEKWRLD